MFRDTRWTNKFLIVGVESHDRVEDVFLSLQKVLLSGTEVVFVHPAGAEQSVGVGGEDGEVN